MTTLEINLPDSLAREAKAAGLLAPEAIERLLRDAVRQRAVEELVADADRLAAVDLPPMTTEEVQAEIDALRAERRARLAGRS